VKWCGCEPPLLPRSGQAYFLWRRSSSVAEREDAIDCSCNARTELDSQGADTVGGKARTARQAAARGCNEVSTGRHAVHRYRRQHIVGDGDDLNRAGAAHRNRPEGKRGGRHGDCQNSCARNIPYLRGDGSITRHGNPTDVRLKHRRSIRNRHGTRLARSQGTATGSRTARRHHEVTSGGDAIDSHRCGSRVLNRGGLGTLCVQHNVAKT